MQKGIKPWLAFCLSLGVFASCSQDGNEPSSATEGGERVTLSLSAEVSVDDSEARAINYKLGANAKGQIVPLPQFEDNQIVEVHTIIKSDRGVAEAKTLKWRYDAAKKKLVLSPLDKDSSKDANNIVISNFNNDGGTKWYISGLIGGILSGTKVTFEGTRVLNGVEGNVDDAVGSLNVPYAFGWTELTIDTQDTNNTPVSGSYKYAKVASSAEVKFAPQGSLIAYKLGTKQKAGAYTFTPTGFTVSSNAFGDKGTFELSTAVPTASAPDVALPAWTEGAASALVYSFATGQEPGTIQHEDTASKTYYAWVMPHKTQPTAISTRVMLKGESSRPEENGFKDYTKTWFTDYEVKSTQLAAGRVHKLSANATHTYRLPIEYVTDYNLAGGDGLTYTRNRDPQPVGVTGDLRFADSHSNDASGYYNGLMIMGRKHYSANPEGRNLLIEIEKVFGTDYYVPTLEQWRGIFPGLGSSGDSYYWTRKQALDFSESMAVGFGDDLIRQSYMADYSAASADNNSQESYIYAIRFKSRPQNARSHTVQVDYDLQKRTRTYYTYPSAPDNSFKCAYRYRAVGGHNNFSTTAQTTAQDLTNRLIIDVVYLGEEVVPTTLEDISNAQWWDSKMVEGLVISKTFPLPGNIGSTDGRYMPGVLAGYGRHASYHSRSHELPDALYRTVIGSTGVSISSASGYYSGYSVRLFTRLKD